MGLSLGGSLGPLRLSIPLGGGRRRRAAGMHPSWRTKFGKTFTTCIVGTVAISGLVAWANHEDAASHPGVTECLPDCRGYVWDEAQATYIQDPSGDYGTPGPADDGDHARPFGGE